MWYGCFWMVYYVFGVVRWKGLIVRLVLNLYGDGDGWCGCSLCRIGRWF